MSLSSSFIQGNRLLLNLIVALQARKCNEGIKVYFSISASSESVVILVAQEELNENTSTSFTQTDKKDKKGNAKQQTQTRYCAIMHITIGMFKLNLRT